MGLYAGLLLAIALTWNAPASSPDPVAGYNVYRSPSGASAWVLQNAQLLTTASYADQTAVTGMGYDYVIVSVDAAGVEGGPSNIARGVAAPTTGPAAPTALTVVAR
jgi:fibronectin type 3 domain-containing protein